MTPKHALITGAAQGLGYEFANQLAAKGWSLTLLDYNQDALEQAVAALTHRFPDLLISAYPLDLTDSSSLANWLQEAYLPGSPQLDLLINNAGITHRSPASSTDISVFERVMRLNWLAPVQLTQALLPTLRKTKGTVIVMASMASWLPLPGRAGYCASKSAVSQHFETWRPELERQGIHLTLAYPSFVATSIETNALGSDGQPTPAARTTSGGIEQPSELVQRVLAAALPVKGRPKPRVWGKQWSPRLGYLLWHLTPRIFRRLMWKKFSADIPNEY